MDYVLSNAQMRMADEYTITGGTPSCELMRRAGTAIADEAEICAKALNKKDVLIVCGAGNNGGDGYVCAEELLKRGFSVSVYAAGGAPSPDNLREKSAYTGRYSEYISGSIIIDCLFGTGLSREVTGEYAEIIERINKSGARVISADIPSGLSGDSGNIMGAAVCADKTVAIAEYKLGHFLNDGPDFCGEIIKKDIGIILPEALQKSCAVIYGDGDIAEYYPKRKRNSHKGTYGTANLVAGSEKYLGAASLAVQAALKSGCGIVKLTTAEKVKFVLAAKLPQTVFANDIDLNAEAIALGMGCGVSHELYEKIKFILKSYSGVFLIDADGLNALSRYGAEILKDKKCKVILTPHIKEFSRLTKLSVKDICADPVACAKSFSKEYGVTVVLKSATTVITDGEKTALNIRGSTALAKGGSGDMLAGFMCGTLARGVEPFGAAVCATFVLGLAAEISSKERTDFCATAYDIIKNIHCAVKRLTQKN